MFYLYVCPDHGDEAVPVRPGVLVDETEAVEELVDWGHHAILETFAEKGERKHGLLNIEVS